MFQFSVDDALCTRCGQCKRDCLSGIIQQGGNRLPSIGEEYEARCLRCQHCLAVCPVGAISILGKSPADSRPIIPDSFPSFGQLAHLMRGRRSIRQYKQENVDPELLSRILATLAHVPTGGNACALTFTVIDDIAVMQQLQQRMIAAIRASASGTGLPERYQPMLDFPDAKLKARLFRGAPHALIVSAPPTVPTPAEDTALAVANFELLALSAGLGSVWWGFLRFFAEGVPEIKAMLGIPEDHIFSGALFGYPAVRYARTVQKDDAAVIRRVSL
ncbi:MAG: nitroreductase family protein [Armatimonadota bacterium]